MWHVMDVVSDMVLFRVLAVPASMAGPNNYRTPAGRREAMVEFYDRGYDFEPELGQFTGGYYSLRALLEQPEASGLNLDGGVPRWSVDSRAMRVVRDWLLMLDGRGVLD